MNRHDRYYWLDADHNVIPVDRDTWAQNIENKRSEKIVAKSDVPGCSEVSTVFLGLDHNYGKEGPPILFETLVFGGQLDGEMERYISWADAEAGHQRMCERVKGAHIVTEKLEPLIYKLLEGINQTVHSRNGIDTVLAPFEEDDKEALLEIWRRRQP